MLRMKKRFRLSSQYRVRRFIGAGYALSGRSVKFYEVRAVHSSPSRQSIQAQREYRGLPLHLGYQIGKIPRFKSASVSNATPDLLTLMETPSSYLFPTCAVGDDQQRCYELNPVVGLRHVPSSAPVWSARATAVVVLIHEMHHFRRLRRPEGAAPLAGSVSSDETVHGSLLRLAPADRWHLSPNNRPYYS
jgi:hypothetical protein